MGRRGGLAPPLLLLLGGALLLGGGRVTPFELREALGGLRGDNARLEGTLRNLSRALGQLRARLRDPPDMAWTQEPPPLPAQPPLCYQGGAPPPPAAAPPAAGGGSSSWGWGSPSACCPDPEGPPRDPRLLSRCPTLVGLEKPPPR